MQNMILAVGPGTPASVCWGDNDDSSENEYTDDHDDDGSESDDEGSDSHDRVARMPDTESDDDDHDDGSESDNEGSDSNNREARMRDTTEVTKVKARDADDTREWRKTQTR
jgi:hypothetical protein